MTGAVVLINRGGGAVAADPKIAGKVADALKSAGVTATIELVDGGTLERTLRIAASVACDGDVVLLSPACASYDQFRDYEARGERFRALVEALT